MSYCELQGLKDLPESWDEFYKALTRAWPLHEKLPVVYSDKYNLNFLGFNWTFLDSSKYRKIINQLIEGNVISATQVVEPIEATDEVLQLVHTQEFITQMQYSNFKIVQLTEMPQLLLLPNLLLRWRIISPLKHHVSGTVLAAGLALQHGWAINLGGGFHHASRDCGRAWCPFADVSIAIKALRASSEQRVTRVLVVDLDALQGNGIARDKLAVRDSDLFLIDMYNAKAFPSDNEAKEGIDVNVELKPGTEDSEYLAKLRGALIVSLEKFGLPDFILYNAGANVLKGDPVGRLGLSPEGLIQRNQIVWEHARKVRAPICMLLSGGFSKGCAPAVASSIEALFKEFHLGTC